MEIKIVGDWVIDFRLRTAYRRLRSGGYLRRHHGGEIEFMWDPPCYVNEIIDRYEKAIKIGQSKKRKKSGERDAS